MFFTVIAWGFRLIGLVQWAEALEAIYKQKKEISDAVRPYKAEADVLAAPGRDKHAVSEQLRRDRDT